MRCIIFTPGLSLSSFFLCCLFLVCYLQAEELCPYLDSFGNRCSGQPEQPSTNWTCSEEDIRECLIFQPKHRERRAIEVTDHLNNTWLRDHFVNITNGTIYREFVGNDTGLALMSGDCQHPRINSIFRRCGKPCRPFVDHEEGSGMIITYSRKPAERKGLYRLPVLKALFFSAMGYRSRRGHGQSVCGSYKNASCEGMSYSWNATIQLNPHLFHLRDYIPSFHCMGQFPSYLHEHYVCYERGESNYTVLGFCRDEFINATLEILCIPPYVLYYNYTHNGAYHVKFGNPCINIPGGKIFSKWSETRLKQFQFWLVFVNFVILWVSWFYWHEIRSLFPHF
uniref:Uncharacterized protein n=1 Tax=Pond slider nidovirus TaxID=2961778 RepID=A0A9N6YJM1_9NIDO|nr:TPA_asm: hypothetical protein [Pond slider nidovirus]